MAEAAAKSLDGFPDIRATVFDTVGCFYFSNDELRKARELHEEALQLRRSSSEKNSLKVVESMNNLAFLKYTGRQDDAEATYHETLAMIERLIGADHPIYAATLKNLGALLRDQGRYDEAETAFHRGLKTLSGHLDSNDHPAIADISVAFARTVCGRGRRSLSSSVPATSSWLP